MGAVAAALGGMFGGPRGGFPGGRGMGGGFMRGAMFDDDPMMLGMLDPGMLEALEGFEREGRGDGAGGGATGASKDLMPVPEPENAQKVEYQALLTALAVRSCVPAGMPCVVC